MMRKLGEALFIVFLIWVGWVLVLGASPQQRMDRACTIVSGPGNMLAAMASALNNDWGVPIEEVTINGTYRCRLTLWNFFYAKEWAKTHPGQPLPGSQPTPGYSPLVIPNAATTSEVLPDQPASPAPSTAPSSAPQK